VKWEVRLQSLISQSQQNASNRALSKYLRRAYDPVRSQIVPGAPVILELPELSVIEGGALRSIASGRQCLLCSVKIPVAEPDVMRWEQMTARRMI